MMQTVAAMQGRSAPASLASTTAHHLTADLVRPLFALFSGYVSPPCHPGRPVRYCERNRGDMRATRPSSVRLGQGHFDSLNRGREAWLGVSPNRTESEPQTRAIITPTRGVEDPASGRTRLVGRRRTCSRWEKVLIRASGLSLTAADDAGAPLLTDRLLGVVPEQRRCVTSDGAPSSRLPGPPCCRAGGSTFAHPTPQGGPSHRQRRRVRRQAPPRSTEQLQREMARRPPQPERRTEQ